MSRLRIFDEGNPGAPRLETRDHAAIARELGARGIRFEQWQAGARLEPGASQDQVLAAYSGDIDRLKREKNYQAVDVISLNKDHPEKGALRQKFLNEHTHSEDEVRFFVAGSGLFTLHLGEEVCEVLCEQGDLIGVPEQHRRHRLRARVRVQHRADLGLERVHLRVQQRLRRGSQLGADGAPVEVDEHDVLGREPALVAPAHGDRGMRLVHAHRKVARGRGRPAARGQVRAGLGQQRGAFDAACLEGIVGQDVGAPRDRCKVERVNIARINIAESHARRGRRSVSRFEPFTSY